MLDVICVGWAEEGKSARALGMIHTNNRHLGHQYKYKRKDDTS